MRLGLVNLRAAVVAAVDARVILAGFAQSTRRGRKVSQIQAVAGVRQPAASNPVDFVIAVRLGDLVNVVLHLCGLLSEGYKPALTNGSVSDILQLCTPYVCAGALGR